MLTSRIAKFMLIGIVASLLAISSALWAVDYASDSDINDAIQRRISSDWGMRPNSIVVETNNGIVKLTGSVDNILASDRAIDIARTTKGVRSVINTMDINPIKRTDEEILKDITDAIVSDAVADHIDINVKVTDGVVTTSGTVDSFAESDLIERVVKGVKGVKKVENGIKNLDKSNRSDEDIKADIEGRLKNDVLMSRALVNVSVNNGNVKLTGAIGTPKTRLRAKYNAEVTGTKSVNIDDLEVDWSRYDKMSDFEFSIHRSDPEIKSAIEDAFHYDPRVNPNNVGVYVKDHIVILTGNATHLSSAQAAENDAVDTFGVWQVINRINVKSEPSIDDSALSDSILKALMRDPYLGNFHIKIAILNGNVTLSGNVDSPFSKRHAGEVVLNIKGIVSINNKLEFENQAKEIDSAIKDKIDYMLSWSPFVNSEKINVDVKDGMVILTGSVNSAYENKTAETIAQDGGANTVVNVLKVIPPSEK